MQLSGSFRSEGRKSPRSNEFIKSLNSSTHILRKRPSSFSSSKEERREKSGNFFSSRRTHETKRTNERRPGSKTILLIQHPRSACYIGSKGAFTRDGTIGFTRRILRAAKVRLALFISYRETEGDPSIHRMHPSRPISRGRGANLVRLSERRFGKQPGEILSRTTSKTKNDVIPRRLESTR